MWHPIVVFLFIGPFAFHCLFFLCVRKFPWSFFVSNHFGSEFWTLLSMVSAFSYASATCIHFFVGNFPMNWWPRTLWMPWFFPRPLHELFLQLLLLQHELFFLDPADCYLVLGVWMFIKFVWNLKHHFVLFVNLYIQYTSCLWKLSPLKVDEKLPIQVPIARWDHGNYYSPEPDSWKKVKAHAKIPHWAGTFFCSEKNNMFFVELYFG